MDPSTTHEVTRLLRELQDGDPEAGNRLVPLLYRELRQLAAGYMKSERPDHTLQPTELVHEAYLKLVDQRAVRWQSRSHFLGIAAQAMRRILVDHARKHRSERRGGGRKVTLHDELRPASRTEVDLLALEEALLRLEELDSRALRVVELRFFGGLGVQETAHVMGVSTATVKRDWRHARTWLRRELGPDPGSPPGGEEEP